MSGPGPLRAVARLAAELQALRERTGLSLVALAAKTPYSKSTWARYLSGNTLPPWAAAQALAALADEPEARLRAVWELAEEEWSGRGVVGGGGGTGETPSRPETSEPAAGAASSKSEMRSAPAPALAASPQASPVPSTAVRATTTATATATAAAASSRHERHPGLRTALVAVGGIIALCLVAYGIGSVYAGHDDQGAPAPRTSAGDVVWGPLGCGGQSCDGRDPSEMNCGVDPVSLGTLAIAADTSLEVRYKGPCQAAWARVLRSQVGDVLSITADTGATQSTDITSPYDAGSYSYTPMVPALKHGMHLKACLTPPRGKADCVSVTVP